MALVQCLAKAFVKPKEKVIMGYRLNDNSEDEPFKEVTLSKLDELPPDLYKELVERSMAMASRLNERGERLQNLLKEHKFEIDSDEASDAFFRTSIIEQLAFFEMQINNIHVFLKNHLQD